MRAHGIGYPYLHVRSRSDYLREMLAFSTLKRVKFDEFEAVGQRNRIGTKNDASFTRRIISSAHVFLYNLFYLNILLM